MKKIITFVIAMIFFCTLFTACNQPVKTTDGGDPTFTPSPTPAGDISTSPIPDNGDTVIKCDNWTTTITKFDSRGEEDKITTTITLADAATVIDDKGAIYKDGYVIITGAGTYSISGNLTDGAIIVDLPDTDKAHLILKGVAITSRSYAPICVIAGDKVTITLAAGTTNTLTDGTDYTFQYSALVQPNACLFSKQDLTINGTGSLIINGNANNGITTKDDLKILGGTYNIKCTNHGMRGNDSVVITGGTINIYSGNDGIKTTNIEDNLKGYIFITGGSLTVRSSDDALQAVTAVYITDGSTTVAYGGKAINCDGAIWIKDGTFSEVDY